MKTFSLLRLENNANRVVFTTKAKTVEAASVKFNQSVKGFTLDKDGYAKFSETVSFCVAEHWDPLHEID